MSATFLASTFNFYKRLLEQHGQDIVLIAREIGFDCNKVMAPGARVEYELNNLLLKKTVGLIDDPCFGLKAAGCWHPSDLNALGYAWLASSSLRTALQRLSRYSRMLSEGLEIILEDKKEELVVYIHYRNFVENIHVRNDMNMAILLDMCRMNYGATLTPVKVTFTHKEFTCSKQYRDYFSCPVIFNSQVDSLTLEKEVADQKLLSSNPHLAQINDQIIISYLAHLESSDITHRVKKNILEQLPSGDISREKIAKDMGLSVRGLQRKLQDQGTSYHTILKQTREELAKKYIEGTNNSMTEIAFLLGFSESSVFSRAFKRWTGVSPLSWRSWQ